MTQNTLYTAEEFSRYIDKLRRKNNHLYNKNEYIYPWKNV